MTGRIIALIIIACAGIYIHQRQDSVAPSAAAEARAPAAAPVSGGDYYFVTQADFDYINDFVRRAANSPSYPGGATPVTLQLPSGGVLDAVVQKKDGKYCPYKRRMLYTTTIDTKKPLVIKQER